MNEIFSSFIAISDDFEVTLNEIKRKFPKTRVVDFIKDSFLVDDAKSVVKEAFIAEKDTKILFLGAKSFNLYAQNSLLKILEEPPKNIVFIICISSKSALLPTIRSRLPIRVFSKKKPLPLSGLDFKKLGAKDVYEFLKQHQYISKIELQNMVQTISKESIESGMVFSDEELDMFGKLLQLSSLNTAPRIILSTQLSIILKKRLHEVS